MSSRQLALIIFIITLGCNQWAFRFMPTSQTAPDPFMQALILLSTTFVLMPLGLFFALHGGTPSDLIRKKRQSSPRLTAIYIGALLSLMLILSVEFTCRLYFKYFYTRPFVDSTEWQPAPKIADEKYGYTLPANTALNHKYLVNDSLIFTRTYHLDEYHRRQTPQDSNLVRRKFLIVSGCSYAFGYGVSDSETIAYKISHHLTQYKPYNYGTPGYGSQQMLIKQITGYERNEIKEDSGIFIYLFIDNHIRRAIGSRRVIKLWGEDFPNFEWAKGVLERKGSFKTGKPYTYLIYKTLSSSAFVELFDIDFPIWIDQNQIEFTAQIIGQSKDLFEKQHPNSLFLVVFAPGSTYASSLQPILAKKRVETLNLSQLLDPTQRAYLLHYSDPHPNAKYYEEVSSKIIEKIATFENPNK